MAEDRKDKQKINSKEYIQLFKKTNIITSFGITVISNIAIGGLIGYYLDKWTFNNKVLLLIFLILGIVSGIYNGIKLLMKEAEKENGKDKKS
ncbi:MAG: AtpZ/AtpI family protein [Thermotogae bacterium]|jgi:F0F1-type ATP synthase assembly protein I|nr:AtpZ/AtpI family protein [Thermotogota bacterium]MCL5032862.1 AtpZ/AtpI family protein [Thermotogota bacterium]